MFYTDLSACQNCSKSHAENKKKIKSKHFCCLLVDDVGTNRDYYRDCHAYVFSSAFFIPFYFVFRYVNNTKQIHTKKCFLFIYKNKTKKMLDSETLIKKWPMRKIFFKIFLMIFKF